MLPSLLPSACHALKNKGNLDALVTSVLGLTLQDSETNSLVDTANISLHDVSPVIHSSPTIVCIV